MATTSATSSASTSSLRNFGAVAGRPRRPRPPRPPRAASRARGSSRTAARRRGRGRPRAGRARARSSPARAAPGARRPRRSVSFSRCHSACIAAERSRSSASARSSCSRRATVPGIVVVAQRLQLDLELHDVPVDLVDLGRLGVDLHPDPRGGLVDQVDRLVGQEAVGDVAVAERRRGDQRRVLDADLVVDLVALLEPAQDRDRVLDASARRRAPAGSGARAPRPSRCACGTRRASSRRRAQLAAGEHRLEQVGGVDRALGRAGADDRVQLVDEQDDLALGVGDLLEHGLQPVLELAAVLGAGDHRADVERRPRGGPAGPRARRRRRSAARGPRRSRSCRRRARRSAPGCSWCGARGPGSRGGSRRRGRSPGRACPGAAASVRSRPNRSSAWNLSSGFWSVTRWLPRTSASALSSSSWVAPADAQRVAGLAGVRGEREQQVLGRDVLVLELAHLVLGGAQDLDELARAAGRLGLAVPLSFGSASSAGPSAWRTAAGSTPSLRSTGTTTPPSCSSSTASRCSGVVCGLRRSSASRCAACSASWDLDRESVWLHRRSRSRPVRKSKSLVT